MPLFEISDSGLRRQAVATFKELGMYERVDLQPLLRDDISALDDDLFVVAEEYGNWEDARRRIDLLAIDKAGCLVVIELKRTDDGGHMELQALRYAAMVSSLDFDDVVDAYSRHSAKHRPGEEIDARAELVAFLEDDGDEPVISTDVRIVLVSADFGREITTTVLWLNRFDGMDIRCVRLVPYEIDGKVLLDIQQVLPLPEAADYQVKLRRKDAARERARATSDRDYARFHVVVDGEVLPAENKRHSIRVMVRSLVNNGAPLSEIARALPPARFRAVPGRITEGDAVRAALTAAHPGIRARRYFCDHPFIDDEADQTYVLSNQWGSKTEPTLEALAQRFSETKVTFRRAEEGDE